MVKRKVIKIFSFILSFIFISLSALFIISSDWAVDFFGNVNFNEIFFHLLVPMEGTSSDIINKYISDCIPITIFAILFILFIVYFVISKDTYVKIRIGKIKIHINFKKTIKRLLFIAILFICSVLFALNKLDFRDFIDSQFTNSDFMQSNYVDPRDTTITFPSKKRNLVYIFLESMENTYEDMNIVPELTELRQKNVNFNDEHGSYSLGNTTWTIAAMVAQMSGIPLNSSVEANSMNLYEHFLPGLYNLGDLLKDNGYSNYLLVGSDASFGGRKKFFEEHGDYNIWDLNTAIDTKRMTKEQAVWWGFDDSDLFKYAKEELSAIDKSEPFNYTLLTVNTHHWEGWLEDDCPTPYDDHYANVIACSSTQISNFVNWIKSQPWYDNTTIVISGDHPSMNKSFFDNLPKDYVRTVYNTIINPAIPYTEGAREYTTMDMFPTTVASLGIKIDGDRLGLGTNLFSSKYTLTELYGKDKVNKEISLKSDFYTDKFFQGEKASSE